MFVMEFLNQERKVIVMLIKCYENNKVALAISCFLRIEDQVPGTASH